MIRPTRLQVAEYASGIYPSVDNTDFFPLKGVELTISCFSSPE